MATLADPGKLIRAKHPGNCRECGGDILVGQPIYFSHAHGSRHKRCVEPGDAPAPAAGERAPRAASGRDASRDGWLWAERDGTLREETTARDDAGPGGDAPRDEPRAARATEFGRAGDRDAARREVGHALDLVIEALQRVRRMLA